MAGPPIRPNLFLVGAMKSGTTTLAALLDRHPAISVSDPKEPCAFVDPEILRIHWPSMWSNRYWASEAAYRSLFAAVPETRYLCDASTLYSKRPDIEGVAGKIAAYAPDARILYIMREPSSRAISHYWHEYRGGDETRPIETAIWTEPSRYLNYGRYAMQLAPYLAHFGRERVFPVVMERLESSPESTLRDILSWLELDPADTGQQAPLRAHTAPAVSENPALQGPLYRALRADWLNPVKRLVPTTLKTLVKTGLGGATRQGAVDTTTLKAALRDYYTNEIREVERTWLGPVPEWRNQ